MTKILMYHSISSRTDSEVGAELYCVTEREFSCQLSVISCQKSSVIVTFDDGLLDNYTIAYPILKEMKLNAYFFILVSKIGTTGYMSWEQIRELRDAGMTIGSHGMTHRILTELSDEELDYDLRESKKILEEDLGCVIDYLSVPRGFYNKKIIEKARQLGYKGVFTSDPKDTDGFKFGRIPVKANWDLKYFERVINDGYSLNDKAKELLKTASKYLLGAKSYDSLRTKVLKLKTNN